MKSKKLIVISDTKAFKKKNQIFLFEPVVKELSYLSNDFKQLKWLVFEHKRNYNNLVEIENSNIKIRVFPKIGGQTLYEKLKIFFFIPSLLKIIFKLINQSSFVHARAPSVPASLTILLIPFFKNKTFWFKYAGNWKGEASLSYRIQRRILKFSAIYCKNVKLTINGNWEKSKNIFSFENPCLSEKEVAEGVEIIHHKSINFSSQITICFVGNLVENKGIFNLLEAVKSFSFKHIKKLEIVGGSDHFDDIINKYNYLENIELKFHNYQTRDYLKNIYISSHFIFLPSKSEGFPKVIAEAMNYGCIPVVSNISCINQYITHSENGYLLPDNSVENIQNALKFIESLTHEQYRNMVLYPENNMRKFTYEYYCKRIKEEIFCKS